MKPVQRTEPTTRAWRLLAALSLTSFVSASALAADAAPQELTAAVAPTAPADAEAEPTTPVATDDALVPATLLQLPPNSGFYPSYAFVVDKHDRKLTVWQQTNGGLKRVAEYPTDLGRSAGEKVKRNDRKTPEGVYFLLERREGAGLDFNLYGQRAFTTDYPNFFDRLDGKTGDGIWLHAVPDHVPLTRGSSGCVVVRNDVIANLTQYVKLGRTPLLIEDHQEMVSPKEAEHRTAEVAKWLEGWRASWEGKKLNDYIANYADDFRSMHMNRNQWKSYKGRLNNVYKSIAVHLSKPAIYVDRNRAVVRFLQEYNSDRKADLGEKVLYLKKVNGAYKILGETWSEESSEQARQEIEPTKSATKVSCTGTCVPSRTASAH